MKKLTSLSKIPSFHSIVSSSGTRAVVIAALAVGLGFGCQSGALKSKSSQPIVNKAEANLLETEAMARSSAVSDVSYNLELKIGEPDPKFNGRAVVTFKIKAVPDQLFLDFKDGAGISSLIINGTTQAAPQFTDHRLRLPAASLKPGENSVEIVYQQEYSNNGRGLYRFKDPEDGRYYLYTQFEEYDAHQMFPCFDQPDMKATMVMKVTAPKAWEVITTTREESKRAADGSADLVEWSFPQTPRLSTYLFSLHAGPYKRWESKVGNIPLRLFARQSLAKYVRTSDWFVPTQQGLEFYGKTFGYAYPFKKYDQIIVPDFNAGAMENVAAITFTERFIHRGKETREDRETTASVILHEMAHQWFGDLVTMKWWSGTWLNESFATYMSALAMADATEFKDSWLDFYSHEKVWAYREDQQVTTHPIDFPIKDTETASTNFDGITYGKGASVLKQLSYFIGANAFKQGVRDYFKKYAYQNTSLEDFMGSIGNAAHRDLSGWSASWLRDPGVDTVIPVYTCESGKVANFALQLSGPGGKGASPRQHRTLVALYQSKKGQLNTIRSADVTYANGTTTVASLNGAPCPDLVDANKDDHDYVKVQLDKRSLQFASANISSIKSAFTRLMLWQDLFEMVRDQELLPQKYAEIVVANFAAEDDLKVGLQIMRTLPSIIYYLPRAIDGQGDMRATEVSKLEKTLWTKISASRGGSDWQMETLDGFYAIVESPKGRNILLDVLDGKTGLRNFKIDQDRRWNILIALSGLGDPHSAPLLLAEQKKDGSERGLQNEMAAEAARPDLENKEIWLNKTIDDQAMSYSRKRTILSSFLPRTQDVFRQDLAKEYFTDLPKMAQNTDETFLNLFASYVMPTTCSEQSARALAMFETTYQQQLPPKVVKSLRVGVQEDKRCVDIRAKAAQGTEHVAPIFW